jgi:hypothetical protein
MFQFDEYYVASGEDNDTHSLSEGRKKTKERHSVNHTVQVIVVR